MITNNTDIKLYDKKGEFVCYADFLTDINHENIIDSDDSTRLILFTVPPKQI